MKSLSLVLPVWNGEGFIAEVVRDIEGVLEEAQIDYELLLVENGSVDKSLEVIRKLSRKNPRCRVVIRPKGYGSAVIGGLKEATKELVGYMPSDGQIDPDGLTRLLKIWEERIYDLVKIRRLERESALRKLNSHCFNLIARFLFGLKVKDINGSPKIFLRKFVPKLGLKSLGNLVDLELLAKAKRLHWRIGETESKSLPRAGGKSHVNLFVSFQFFLEMIRLRFDPALMKPASHEKF